MDPGRVCAIKSFRRNDSRHGHCIKITLADSVSKQTQEALKFFRDHGSKDVLVTFGMCGSVVSENSDLLSTLSRVWKAAIINNLSDPKQLKINRLDKETFEILVDLILKKQAFFCSLADLVFLSDVVRTYRIDKISEKLELEIVHHLTVDVVSELLSHWPLEATGTLFAACRNIALTHFDKFVNTPGFRKIGHDLLGSLIDDDKLETESEDRILDAVAQWLSANPKCPSDDCEKLLRKVRLGLVSNEHMLESLNKLGPFANVLREWIPVESSSSDDIPVDLEEFDNEVEQGSEVAQVESPSQRSRPRLQRTEVWDWAWYSQWGTQLWYYHPENNVEITCLTARDEELVLMGTSVGLVEILNPTKGSLNFLQLFDPKTTVKHVVAWKEWAVAAVGSESRLWNLRTRDFVSLTRDQSKVRNPLTGSWGSSKRAETDEVRALVDAGEQLLIGYLRTVYVWTKGSKHWTCPQTKALDSDLRSLAASGGRAICAMGPEVMRVWDPADGADLMDIDCRDKPICCLAAGEGYLFAICGHGSIHKWCLETGELVKSEAAFREQGGQRVRKAFVVVQGTNIITGVGRYVPTQDFDVCVRDSGTLEVAHVLKGTAEGCSWDLLFGGQNVVGAFLDRHTILWLAGRPHVPTANHEGLLAMEALRERFLTPPAEDKPPSDSKWSARLPWRRSWRKAQGCSREGARLERPHQEVEEEAMADTVPGQDRGFALDEVYRGVEEEVT